MNPFVSQIISTNYADISSLVRAEFDKLKENKEWAEIDNILADDKLGNDFYTNVILLDETWCIREKLKNRQKLVEIHKRKYD